MVDARSVSNVEEHLGRLDIHLAGEVRLTCAGGVADDGGEVDDRVDAFDCLSERLRITEVSLMEGEITRAFQPLG
ncbi:hypothetical protein AQI88_29605 [Streptomyces cellostaticus]|uniref:Uncharacterized protein n=1 Tax=Streptomyces cellostaticus TaxID=67285 RepID=A0A124HC07_9ACTN|nr:hypothetical protein AQI88_29605 [Streptomyces cellostaticus]